jgi:DNA primase
MTPTESRDKVEEIKSRLDIVDVIGKAISLKNKGGGEYVGTVGKAGSSGESLKVSKSLQAWKDHKNGPGGDVIDWIGYNAGYRDTRGSDFPEVLKIAADLAGVELEEATEEERKAAIEKADIHNLFTEAAEAYNKNLKERPEHYDYIKEKWGITPETVDKFKIGYATTGRDLKDIDKNILKKSGLVYVNGGMLGGEVFTGRIIFPYWKNGKVVYLIGRETEETPEAEREKGMKYKKLLVHKEKHEYVSHAVQNSYFYGEDHLRGSDYCIITEGVADCIAMLQVGFPCISPVTVQFRDKDHPKLISLTKGLKTVYICNDNEANKAGLKGALSTAEALEAAGIEARLIELPKPEGIDKIDIADYMKDHSPEDFKGLIESSVRLWTYKLNQVVISASSTSIERLRAFKAFILNDLKGMNSEEWTVFVNNEVPEKFRLNKKDIKTTINAAVREWFKRQNDAQIQTAEQKEESEDILNEYPAWAIEKANDILNNDDSFKFILDTWQKRHVGDTNIGENCLCSVVTRNILNCERGLHIKPSGESGKGKSDAIECLLELLPDGTYITGSISAKSLFYDPDLKPGTIIYSDDASFSEDVIATIKQSTSKFQKPTVHRTVVNGEFKALPIPERIIFMFSAVDGMDDEQLANRFLHAEVDNSKEQDHKVHQHQKDTESWYKSDMVEPDILICRCIFDIIFKEFYRVKIPFVDAITWNNTENRRNFDKFKDVIRAVTVYNYRNRENFEGFILAKVEDYERALKIYKGTSVNNATNLTDTEIKYLRYITSAPQKTVTVKMLQNHFKVSDIAVRNMLNGKKGNGGLLAKVKQLVVWDESTSVKTDTVTKASREKRYQYTGDLTGLDLYESISTIDYEAVERVTIQYKARLYENKTRVTEGNLMGNLSEVTLENDKSNHNNIINNNNITINKEHKEGYDSGVNICNEADQLDEASGKNNFSCDTLHSTEVGYASQEGSQPITETSITTPGYGEVTLSYDGYPSDEKENIFAVVGLLKKALRNFAKTEYNSTVDDLPGLVKRFNEKTPSYAERLGNNIVYTEAEKLHKWGFR